MSAPIWFALGFAAAWLLMKVLARLGKSAIGKRVGIGRDARRKMLATTDHDALLVLRDDLMAELDRRAGGSVG